MSKIEFCDDIESEERQREINLLLSYAGIEESIWCSDESYLGDFTDLDQPISELANRIREKLNVHFDEKLYLWQIVDEIKKQKPEWPNE